MVRQLTEIGNNYLRRCHAQVVRCAQAFRDWFQELSSPLVSQTRGVKLLRDWLSPEQLTQYDATGYFHVIGSDSGKRYRICHGTAMNVYEIDLAGNPRNGWCFVPNAPLVAGDVMLAQKIALETDERGALVVAKKFLPSASAFANTVLARRRVDRIG
jgi:hypothetical protein